MSHLCTEDCLYFNFCMDIFVGEKYCIDFEDRSYYLHPKYRLNDHVWTFVYDEKDERKPIGVGEFFICGIQYDDEGFWYLDCDCIPFSEDETFATKEEAEGALKKCLEV